MCPSRFALSGARWRARSWDCSRNTRPRPRDRPALDSHELLDGPAQPGIHVRDRCHGTDSSDRQRQSAVAGKLVITLIGAYASASFTTDLHLPFVIAAVLAVLLATIVGLVIGLPTVRISGMYLAVATVALVFVCIELLSGWDAVLGRSGPAVGATSWAVSERSLYYVTIGVAAVVTLALWNVGRSRVGRAWEAMKASEPAALAAGVRPFPPPANGIWPERRHYRYGRCPGFTVRLRRCRAELQPDGEPFSHIHGGNRRTRFPARGLHRSVSNHAYAEYSGRVSGQYRLFQCPYVDGADLGRATFGHSRLLPARHLGRGHVSGSSGQPEVASGSLAMSPAAQQVRMSLDDRLKRQLSGAHE